MRLIHRPVAMAGYAGASGLLAASSVALPHFATAAFAWPTARCSPSEKCSNLKVAFVDRADTLQADVPVTVVATVSNQTRPNGEPLADQSDANVASGTPLFRITPSEPIGYLKFVAPNGYTCDPPGPAVASLECSTSAADTIAVGASRTFTFRLSAPGNVNRPTASARITLIAEVDPNDQIPTLSEGKHGGLAETDKTSATVSPPNLAVLNRDNADKVSVQCSNGNGFIIFDPILCEVFLHPSTTSTGPVTLPAGMNVVSWDVNGFRFSALGKADKRFSCSASSDLLGQSFVGGCVTTKQVVIQPGQSVHVTTLSGWVTVFLGSFGTGHGPQPGVDWELCVLGFAPSNCFSFGGSASTD